MLLAGTPPIWVNSPPTYTLLPDTASACTPPSGASADQLLPSHLATPTPPAYRSLPDTASAHTPPKPEPSADQAVPSHLAMLLTGTPPAVPNAPPADRSLPDTASAYTGLFMPA